MGSNLQAGGKGGVFESKNLGLYSYAHLNPVIMIDLFGLEAYEATKTYKDINVNEFKQSIANEAKNIVQNKEKLDCADAAIVALARAAKNEGVPLTMKGISSESSKYDINDPGAFDQFVADLKNGINSTDLIDSKLTIKLGDANKVSIGDLVGYDLRQDKAPNYSGHIMTKIGDAGFYHTFVEGHTTSAPRINSILFLNSYEQYEGGVLDGKFAPAIGMQWNLPGVLR